LALCPVPLEDLPLHLGGDAGLAPLLLGEEEIQRGVDDLLVGGVGLDVGLPVAGLPELGQQVPRHGEVDPATCGGQGLDEGTGRFTGCCEKVHRMNRRST